MQRYDFDELTKHECDDGEWVKASEAEAEIDDLKQELKEATEENDRLLELLKKHSAALQYVACVAADEWRALK